MSGRPSYPHSSKDLGHIGILQMQSQIKPTVIVTNVDTYFDHILLNSPHLIQPRSALIPGPPQALFGFQLSATDWVKYVPP